MKEQDRLMIAVAVTILVILILLSLWPKSVDFFGVYRGLNNTRKGQSERLKGNEAETHGAR
ncbi:MAG: hypothetical protein ABSA67_13155 [Candidatus Brocadiia bacterium]